jgi:hypothetical protein
MQTKINYNFDQFAPEKTGSPAAVVFLQLNQLSAQHLIKMLI